MFFRTGDVTRIGWRNRLRQLPHDYEREKGYT